MAGGPVSWRSARQPIVAQSSCESELIALAETAKEVLYFQDIVAEIFGDPPPRFTIFGDNKGTIDLARNAVYHRRTKHVDVRYFFIRDCIAKDAFKVVWVPTETNIADGFTKALTAAKFATFVEHFLVPCPSK
mmetsp:Transcript_17978/g.52450  ORF Transcript_17978/g.52450 Transcript_17978/m.52450 type:complete len:133 (-) Transcript_17978:298-696(-)